MLLTVATKNHPFVRARYAVYTTAVAVVAGLLMALPVGATGVIAQVHDDLPGTFSIASPADGATVEAAELAVSGSLHNISQILVFVDGVYVSTVPFDVGAASFSLTIPLTPGLHTVRLSGTDPYLGVQVDHTFAVTYSPVLTPQSVAPATPGQVATDIVNSGSAAVSQTVANAQTQITTASATGPMKVFTDGLFTVMVDAGVIVPNSVEKTKAMATRISLVSVGTGLMVFPSAAYLWVARRTPTLLQQRLVVGPVPKVMRLVGLGLVVVPFLVS